MKLYYLEDGDKHYITIGNKSPWQNPIWIRLPRNVCVFLNKYIT